MKLWPAESFHLATVGDAEGATPQDFQWVETALTPAGEVVSSCIAHLDHGFQLVGVRWDTGRENAMDVHLPWQKQARGAIASHHSNDWEISCGLGLGEPVARGVPASFPAPDGSPDGIAIQSQVPAYSVGMELLGRSHLFLDFPHGRIWLPRKVSQEPIWQDHSGLLLKYGFVKDKGDHRGLFVEAIRPGTPAHELYKRGLRPGMMVTQLDHIDTEELDSWLVHRRLAGAFGEQVLVQWKTSQGLKMGAMKVR